MPKLFSRSGPSFSKALFSAGLLGGAAISTLGAGSAQAAWDLKSPNGYQCTVGGTFACDFTGNDPTPTPVARPGSGLFPEDKILTLLGQNGFLAGDKVEFAYVAHPNQYWELKFGFATYPTAGDSGNLDYKLQITDPRYVFRTAELTSNIGGSGPYNITKKFYTDSSFTSESFSPGISTPPTPQVTNIGGQEIFVRDSWNVPVGSSISINGINSNYTQAVPGPLPILGIAAAFRFSRRLRNKIKASKAPEVISTIG
jgi:hypothetical protein